MNAERKAKIEAALEALQAAKSKVSELEAETRSFYHEIDTEHPDYDDVENALFDFENTVDHLEEDISSFQSLLSEDSSSDDDVEYDDSVSF